MFPVAGQENMRLSYPEEAEAIDKEFYTNDLMFGTTTVEGAIQKQRIIHSILSRAKLSLRKYTSNTRKELESINQQLVEKHEFPKFDSESCVSVLGLQ